MLMRSQVKKSTMTRRYKWQIFLYLFITGSLIITNCILDYYNYASNSKFHDLTYFQRNAVRVSGLTEVILSPFQIISSLFFNIGNVRDHQNMNFFIFKMISLPFSFLWYFKTIRLQLFALLRRKLMKRENA